MKLKPLLKGVLTYIPGSRSLVPKRAHGADSARYCYSVWLRHLVMAHEHGLINKIPAVVAELGPGNSLGIALSALISGAHSCYAFDVVKHANDDRNIEIFDQLINLFAQREDIPNEEEFPEVKPFLKSYKFPSSILTEKHLEETLGQGRIKSIRNALMNMDENKDCSGGICYIVPWDSPNLLAESSVDMIYSQAVLEHVDDLPFTYQALYRWLKPGGFMSHQIDFKCHGCADKWNGHWSYSDFMWKLTRGNRPYLINRKPHSTHIRLLTKYNFKIICDQKIQHTGGIKREKVSSKFKSISDDDLITCGAFIQALK